MQEFIEIPASKMSLASRKLILGVGINDSDYMVNPRINGNQVICPYYTVWANMIKRSYSEKYQKRNPTYIGCSVVKEWLTFSSFRDWMKKQDWKSKQIDKDILTPNNKIYSPDTCIFVSSQINSLLLDRSYDRGDFPQGVGLNKRNGKYKASCSVNGGRVYLGIFTTVNEAEYVYLTFKADLIKQTAYEPEAASSPKLQAALLRHADIFTTKANKLRSLL